MEEKIKEKFKKLEERNKVKEERYKALQNQQEQMELFFSQEENEVEEEIEKNSESLEKEEVISIKEEVNIGAIEAAEEVQEKRSFNEEALEELSGKTKINSTKLKQLEEKYKHEEPKGIKSSFFNSFEDLYFDLCSKATGCFAAAFDSFRSSGNSLFLNKIVSFFIIFLPAFAAGLSNLILSFIVFLLWKLDSFFQFLLKFLGKKNRNLKDKINFYLNSIGQTGKRDNKNKGKNILYRIVVIGGLLCLIGFDGLAFILTDGMKIAVKVSKNLSKALSNLAAKVNNIVSTVLKAPASLQQVQQKQTLAQNFSLGVRLGVNKKFTLNKSLERSKAVQKDKEKDIKLDKDVYEKIEGKNLNKSLELKEGKEKEQKEVVKEVLKDQKIEKEVNTPQSTKELGQKKENIIMQSGVASSQQVNNHSEFLSEIVSLTGILLDESKVKQIEKRVKIKKDKGFDSQTKSFTEAEQAKKGMNKFKQKQKNRLKKQGNNKSTSSNLGLNR